MPEPESRPITPAEARAQFAENMPAAAYDVVNSLLTERVYDNTIVIYQREVMALLMVHYSEEHIRENRLLHVWHLYETQWNVEVEMSATGGDKIWRFTPRDQPTDDLSDN